MLKALRRLYIRFKGQSILEMTMALIAVFVLLLGTARLFVWINERMVLRQREFEMTRVPTVTKTGGTYDTHSGTWLPATYQEVYKDVDESKLPKLDILGPVMK